MRRASLLTVLVLASNAISMPAKAAQRQVTGELVDSGYEKKNGDYLLGPEGTDQVWAQWKYRGCADHKLYKRHMLVHSVVFPEPGGIFLLSVADDGWVTVVKKYEGDEPSC